MSQKSTAVKERVIDFKVLRSHVMTEKTLGFSGKQDSSVVVFEVDKRSSKFDVKSAVERVFGVEVAKVRTQIRFGKMKRTTRSIGRTAATKRAIVVLKPGSQIDELIEGV